MKFPTLQSGRLQRGGATVLLLSSEMWGTSWLTKHNYAAALASLGNKVYYVNPCSRKCRPYQIKLHEIKVSQNSSSGTVIVVDTALPVPGRVREWDFRIRSLVMKWPARLIRKHLSGPADLVIDFGSQFPDLMEFKPAARVYFPVDEIAAPELKEMVNCPRPKNSELMFSVSEAIFEPFHNLEIPALNLGHGLNGAFIELARNVVNGAKSSQPGAHNGASPRVGYIGNLGSQFLDARALTSLVMEHSGVQFEFFGPFDPKNTNLGVAQTTTELIRFLRSRPNVLLHGPMAPDRLAANIRHIDLWLLCYKAELGQGRACNSHKLLEYMATGNCIVSNPMRILEEQPFSSFVARPRFTGEHLMGVFDNVISNVHCFNTPELRNARASFALSKSYHSLIRKIDVALTTRGGLITYSALTDPQL